jgi:hypothetical protein
MGVMLGCLCKMLVNSRAKFRCELVAKCFSIPVGRGTLGGSVRVNKSHRLAMSPAAAVSTGFQQRPLLMSCL